MKRIIFMGDSITDFGRRRDCPPFRQDRDCMGAGTGYANRLMGEIMYRYPKKYQVINVGIGGNKVTDIYSRVKSDCIDFKPDYLTVLIGVNDVWHEYDFAKGNDLETYVSVYTKYIEEVKAALPEIKIYIVEPFILESDLTRNNVGMIEKVKEYAKAARGVAEKFDLPFIELQAKFDEMTKISNDPTYWAADGVHPTLQGHKLIADRIMETLEKDLDAD